MSRSNRESRALGSWTQKPNAYPVHYKNQQRAETILEELATLPPLVSLEEICSLKSQLKQVSEGAKFMIQCGDCAELFEYCAEKSISQRLALIIRLGLIFSSITGTPTILLGRMAGQYGKPRTTLTETINGQQLPKFYGDNINGASHDLREPDPERLAEAYKRSSLTINCMRTIIASKSPEFVELVQRGFTDERAAERRCQKSTCAAPCLPAVFTSHEALFLHYEQSLTRSRQLTSVQEMGNTCSVDYNGSAHFIWIGDKTRQLGGPHVEYVRGLSNPVGVKLGPDADPDELCTLLSLINTDFERGKVVLITRLGADKVAAKLEPLIRAVQKSGQPVVWQCDPMHGNTWTTENNVKTRSFADMLAELVATIDTHAAAGSRLGGLHLETSSNDIVECIGGPGQPATVELGPLYETKCDPRLNAVQAESLVEQAAKHYKRTGMAGRAGPRI